MKRKSKYSLDYKMFGYKLLEKYSDRQGYRVFILESLRTGTIVFDIVRINYLKRKNDFNRWEEVEIFCLKNKSTDSYFVDPSTFNYNVSFLNENNLAKRQVRSWILKRLNSLPIGNKNKVLGDFQINKNGKIFYNLEELSKEDISES